MFMVVSSLLLVVMVTVDQLNAEPVTRMQQLYGPDVVSLEEASGLLETLSSEKRRAVLRILREQPTNTAELAELVGTSVQNMMYHINELEAAGLVRVVDTHYSAKGKEMKLYEPTSPAIVIDVLGGTRNRSSGDADDG